MMYKNGWKAFSVFIVVLRITSVLLVKGQIMEGVEYHSIYKKTN